jgi:hypothetical protein
VCEANLAGSFGKASRLLESLANLEVSAKQAQLITERIGEILLGEREKSAESFLNRTSEPPVEKEVPKLLIISMDGGRVQTRNDDPKKKWKEDKAAVVYDAVPSPEQPGEEYQGPPPITRSVTATMEPWDALGDYASALADKRGYARAEEKIFISDAAQGIKSVRERCFPDTTYILDWAHARQHLHAMAVAAFGQGEDTETWYERQKDRMWKGHLDAMFSEIEKQSERLGKPSKRAAENDPRRIAWNNLNYFRKNRDAMDYPTFRKKGWPIGSGIIESTIKQIGKRMKGTEKHWDVAGADKTLQVVTHLISKDESWDNFWKRCPHSQRQHKKTA